MTNPTDVNVLKTKIQDELIRSGQYDEISRFLKFKLIENGWFDNVKSMSTSTAAHLESLNYTQLMKELEPKLLLMVPDNVKEETLAKIKQFLDSVIEK